mmetsp:Transcript_12486/g.31435  ORF Transcript_12486/g.31435 Transcript_12486/m.31435 type:complete len:639 (-) Transcript_12486:2383-4299(-)|eukprot:CAMPEP_0116092734 /NCGR_PEP_ID=MMETSP0327-20121206/8203_1 /TAXON_ID=44447 /ORGANISM="Pseudo-nitzschia delicatissima, Strain B596" /LENGTH=638 /DNA_ID=CAMNT_0003584185 /DNA_START=90 /DNA_END=2006 /DNA_ORIENTATION=-
MDASVPSKREEESPTGEEREKNRKRSKEVVSSSSSKNRDRGDRQDRRDRHDRYRKREKRSKKSSRKDSRRKRKKRRRRYSSSESDSSGSSSEDSDSSSENDRKRRPSKKSNVVVNKKLLAKLDARGETLEERKERRSQKRAAKIQARFGYTAEDNPFNDPNLHETFTWNKKKELSASQNSKANENPDTIEEIELIRRRRKERELEREEMDRLRAEEARMKELENYDDWAKKEEEFHLEQQRKRSAIRLVEGREKPIDVLAKNLLIFGLTEEEKQLRAAVKYQERYNALDELQKLDAELDEPQDIVGILKITELRELLVDIRAFQLLEKEAKGGSENSTIIMYWDALSEVVKDEIKFLENGGDDSPYAKKIKGIKSIFDGQSRSDLIEMKEEIKGKASKASTQYSSGDATNDTSYWNSVMGQLSVHLAKMDLSKLHSKMLVRQLEQLESRKEALTKQQNQANISENGPKEEGTGNDLEDSSKSMIPKNVDENFGNLEEELGLSDEVALGNGQMYSWQDRYAPRKPRYFNRIRTGFDWNKYNQTHYDMENPPPKIVQGYKFNVFYPDLVDPTKTPQYFLERADSDEFCILRFHAGPPYEDIAFKIVNREWNKSRKRGFRSTFERGVLSLYFNFTSHWYRR